MSEEEDVALSAECDKRLAELGIESILDCTRCGAELTLRMAVAPTGPGRRHELWEIAYNCQMCFAMNSVWKRAEGTHGSSERRG